MEKRARRVRRAGGYLTRAVALHDLQGASGVSTFPIFLSFELRNGRGSVLPKTWLWYSWNEMREQLGTSGQRIFHSECSLLGYCLQS